MKTCVLTIHATSFFRLKRGKWRASSSSRRSRKPSLFWLNRQAARRRVANDFFPSRKNMCFCPYASKRRRRRKTISRLVQGPVKWRSLAIIAGILHHQTRYVNYRFQPCHPRRGRGAINYRQRWPIKSDRSWRHWKKEKIWWRGRPQKIFVSLSTGITRAFRAWKECLGCKWSVRTARSVGIRSIEILQIFTTCLHAARPSGVEVAFNASIVYKCSLPVLIIWSMNKTLLFFSL